MTDEGIRVQGYVSVGIEDVGSDACGDSAMKAGRELDALVAEKVMGRPAVRVEGVFRANGEALFLDVPPYSTDIAAAFEAAERAGVFTRQCWYLWNSGDGWCVGETTGVNDCAPHICGETPAHVLCLAALKAVGA